MAAEVEREMLLAPSCAGCGARGPGVCPSCARALRPAPSAAAPPGVERCDALLSYTGAGREVVARLKYRNHRAALRGLALAMASLVTGAGRPPHVVAWVPTTPARRRARGFDQSELLARRVARALRVPCRPLLRRADGPAQTGRPLRERRAPAAFLPARRVPAGARVLLVDDVVTTGATVSAAAAVLRQAGASAVRVVAAARTPPPRTPQGRAPPVRHTA